MIQMAVWGENLWLLFLQGRLSKIETFWLVVTEISDICCWFVGTGSCWCESMVRVCVFEISTRDFYVIDKLNVLEHVSGLDFCFRAFSLSVFATTPAVFFFLKVYNFGRPYSQYLHIHVSDLVCWKWLLSASSEWDSWCEEWPEISKFRWIFKTWKLIHLTSFL